MNRPDRLSEIVNKISVSLPKETKITIINARLESAYDFPNDWEVVLVQSFAPFYDKLMNSYRVYPEIVETSDVSVVNIPKSKKEGYGKIAEAIKLTKQFVIVNGGKLEGIDSYLKKFSKLVDIESVIIKDHGKVFCFDPKKINNEVVYEWEKNSKILKNEAGFFSVEGAFSPRLIDTGSKALASYFSDKLFGRVADLGAGWGWLSFEALKQNIDQLDLYEGYYASLQCAKLNIRDDRANYFWIDVMKIDKKSYYNAVIMNPPFHNGNDSNPNLGIDFIRKAEEILSIGGKLFMVANRKLPYEKEVNKLFEEVQVHQSYSGFKIISAKKPM